MYYLALSTREQSGTPLWTYGWIRFSFCQKSKTAHYGRPEITGKLKLIGQK